MEEKVSPWKSNLTNGLILGMVAVVYSLLMYFLDLSLNKAQGYIFMLIEVVILYFLLKTYRDNFLHGQITYGQSVGAGVIIFFYAAIITAIFTYILFAFIDTGLIAKQMAITEQEMRAKGNLTEAQLETAMSFSGKFMKPGIMAFSGIFFSMIFGTIVSLIVSIFVKREGNPLIDTPVN
jgi:hypothetical protein